MKKALYTMLALSLILLMGGCIHVPDASPAPSPSISPMDTPAALIQTETPVSPTPTETPPPEHSAMPEFTLPPGASMPKGDEGAQEREAFQGMKVLKDGWIYYADWKRMFYIQDDYECPIKRKKKDGSEDTYLGITGFKFTLIDRYIYVYKNHVFGDFGHWDTVRMDLDGGNKKALEYANMDIKVYDGRIYFETFNESVLFAADSACENVKKYDIKVPDETAIKERLKDNYFIYMLDIYDVKDGWIYFDYDLVDTDTMPFYEGKYRVNFEGTKVEKINEGEFNEDRL